MSGNGNGKAVAVRGTKELLEDRREEFAKALAGRVDPDAFVRVAYATVTKTPKLMEATKPSLLMALLECASLGLTPNSVMGEAYIVPFNNKVKYTDDDGRERERWETHAQFIPGYRGLAKLARQSGHVTNITARAVREGDRFEVTHGTEEKLVHVPMMSAAERAVTHYYAVAFFRDGPPQFDVMARWEVDRIKGRSKSKSNGPWVTDYDEMAKKTVLRRLAKHLPLSDNDFTRALEADNRDFDMSSSVGGGPVADLNASLEDEPEEIPEAEVVEDGPPASEDEEYERAMAERDGAS
jgi:recombination protein RecT